jgi:hypothetical protein
MQRDNFQIDIADAVIGPVPSRIIIDFPEGNIETTIAVNIGRGTVWIDKDEAIINGTSSTPGAKSISRLPAC